MRRLSPSVITSLALALVGILAFSAAQAQEADYRTYVPVGALTMFAGDPLEAPVGWLIADGSCVSTVTYANLYEVVGDVFDGCVTPPGGDPAFALPDLRGRVPVGTGAGVGLTARTLGDMWGAETHTLTLDQIPPHTHTISGGSTGGAANLFPVIGAGGAGRTATSNSSGGLAGVTQAHNIMQPSIALNYLIWSGVEALEPSEADIEITVVVVFPSHTPTPTLTPTMTETPGPSPTPTATVTPTYSPDVVYSVGDQQVQLSYVVTPGDAATVGLLVVIAGLFIVFLLRRRK